MRMWKMALVFCCLLVFLPSAAFSANDHGQPNLESALWFGESQAPYIVAGCAPAVPGASLTFAAFPCQAYVQGSAGELVYVTQPSRSVGPLNGGNGTYWLAAHRDLSSTVSGWTRQAGTHYLWQLATNQPNDPIGGRIVRQVTVAAGAISASVPVGSMGRLPIETAMRIVTVQRYATGGWGTPTNPWTGWDTAITWQSGTEYVFGAGTFSFAATIAVPTNSILRCASAGTVLTYTGSTNALALNAASAGTPSLWRARIANCRITTATGAAGIYHKDVAEVLYSDLMIDGFSNAGILADSTNTTGASFVVDIINTRLKSNGRGLRFIGGNNHNRYSLRGLRIQGNTTAAGIQADVALKSLSIVGSDIEGNTGAEIRFTNGADGFLISGNHFETNGGSNDAIVLEGTAPYSGGHIVGNILVNNAAAATGRALAMTSTAAAPAYNGLHFHGNAVLGYGAANTAVDFATKHFQDSDFSGNAFGTTIGVPYAFLPKLESTGVVTRRLSGVAQNVTFGTISAGATAEGSFTLTGASSDRGHSAIATPLRTVLGVGIIATIEAGLLWTARVDTANQLTIRLYNSTGGNITPIARDWGLSVEIR